MSKDSHLAQVALEAARLYNLISCDDSLSLDVRAGYIAAAAAVDIRIDRALDDASIAERVIYLRDAITFVDREARNA